MYVIEMLCDQIKIWQQRLQTMSTHHRLKDVKRMKIRLNITPPVCWIQHRDPISDFLFSLLGSDDSECTKSSTGSWGIIMRTMIVNDPDFSCW